MSASVKDMIVDGLEIRFRQGTGGPVLVMLHGIGSNMTSFDRLSATLPDAWTLLAWNAPGYGESRPLTNSAPVAEDYATCLLGLVKALDLPPFLLAGHSLGTLMAVSFARHNPEYVRGLVLLACAQGHGAMPGELGEKSRARLDDLARLGPVEFARTRAPRLLHNPDSMPDVRDSAIAAMSAINPDGYAQAVHMLASGNQAADARYVVKPSLVLVGEQDVITPALQGRAVHEALKGASPEMVHSFHEISDAGHVLHQEFPQSVADRITEFAGVAIAEKEVLS